MYMLPCVCMVYMQQLDVVLSLCSVQTVFHCALPCANCVSLCIALRRFPGCSLAKVKELLSTSFRNQQQQETTRCVLGWQGQHLHALAHGPITCGVSSGNCVHNYKTKRSNKNKH